MTRLVLASTSAARRALLANAGVPVEVAAPAVDEAAVKAALLADDASPRDVADALAEAKAVKVSARSAGLVIGADMTLDLDGRLYDKPISVQEARAHLLDFKGRTHSLHSAVVIAEGGSPVWRHVATARLTMRPFSEAFLDAYLAAEGEALLSSVGCYRLEGLGAQLFERIDGDYFAILGLPLLPILGYLRERGAIAA
jgi:septum formation protein